MNTSRKYTAIALAIAQLLAGITAAQADTTSDAIRRNSQYASVQQAVYQLVAESYDVDNDATIEAPAMKLGTGLGTSDGGVIPDTSSAPKTDGFGGTLGYCVWDNGTLTSSTGRLAGTTAAGAVSLAVISYGLDNVFQTTCADLAQGIVRGDDYAFWMTTNQVTTGASSSTSTYWGAPASSYAALSGLAAGSLHDGEVRITTDTNRMYRWNAGLQQWTSLGAGGGSQNWLDNGAYDVTMANANGRVAIGQTTLGAEKLTINSGASATALGLSGSGSTTGINIYNTAGSSVNTFLGYDNTNSKMLINIANGSFAIKTGGSERFNLGTDGTVTVNGAVFLDANKNLTANGGSFSGVVNAGGGLQVAGTTVIDTGRNLNNINNVIAAGNATVTGYANVGSLQIGGATAIDGSRNGTLATLVTSGGITANGGINTSSLTATGQIVAPVGSSSSPAYTFTGSATTGLYSPSANTLGLVAGGSQVLSATSSGVVLPVGLNVSGGNLVLSSANTSGTLAARPVAGVANRVYVTTDTNEIYRDTGAAWVRIGAATLANLGDMSISGPTGGQTLVYNGSTNKWVNASISAGTGTTVTLGDGAISIGLANTGVTAGSYGSATAAPTFTVDATGRMTAAGSVTITPAWTSITGKPTTVSGYGITDSGVVNYAVNMNQNVRTTDSVTFNSVTAASFTSTGPITLAAIATNGGACTNQGAIARDAAGGVYYCW
ncbi:dihydroorotase [Novimethylophilus kurashikiensis]|uniref:Dihydroorotase n=1 Tax=Novimethylophilus kurashikiensis TaxID=1825523 RepID=A0A2R5FDR1_9PROT|nr:hypothetical protein [Novimethylophilus kurashikiensis]GBG16045.1 dihydroorotase [Novimethylophilus kurashikiensis]